MSLIAWLVVRMLSKDAAKAKALAAKAKAQEAGQTALGNLLDPG